MVIINDETQKLELVYPCKWCYKVVAYERAGIEIAATQNIDCAQQCADKGYNFAIGCGIDGARSDVCNCGNESSLCQTSKFSCYSDYKSWYWCDEDKHMFYWEDCDGYCKSLGYLGSYGCSQRFGCTCRGTITIAGKSYECGGFGTDCSGGGRCCDGLVCTWNYNGGDIFEACLEPVQCPARCMEGGVCCGGAFCAGNCIGNPCCP